MRITKTVPARRVTFTARSLKMDWLKMDENFRKIRAGCRNKLDACFWCRRKFSDGDVMAMALSDSGNKVLCQECAGKLRDSAS